MSWMKGAQGGAPPPGPDRQNYGALQPYGNQQNTYSNYHSTPSNVQQQQQHPMWQLPQQTPQYNQQYGQVYQQQQGFASNSNQFYQQQQQQPIQYNQNYNNQNYGNVPQQGYQQNYYSNQVGPQQNYTESKTNSDGWEDNWDWGWEDASKQAQKPPSQAAPPQQASQVFNNANVIEESFASTDSWNWSMDDKKESRDPSSAPITQSSNEAALPPTDKTVTDNQHVNDVRSQSSPSNISGQHLHEEVRNLSETDVVKERLPNLAMGKRINLENLTPQWSIESQMSQESSDGPQTHSEGTYRSENQSRNSSKSSPGLNTDNSNFNYSHTGYDEVSSQSVDWLKQSDELTVTNNVLDTSRREHNELLTSVQDMKISSHEIVDTTMKIADNDNKPTSSSSHTHITPAMPPPPPVSSVTLQSSASFVPPPAVSPSVSNNNSSSLGMPSSNFFGNTSTFVPPPNFPPSSSTSSLPPPTNFSPSQNPFKHAGPLSHKNIPKGPIANLPTQPFPSPMSSSNLSSPAVPVNKTPQQNRVSVGFGANLETTPDNSERPDQPLVSYHPMPMSQPVPDNMEIAPQNDRNEYLQTAHLSSGDYGENTDFSRDGPHPSLRRMGVGQQDSEYNQNLNMSGDEPPPGLARMVPGQQNEADHGFNQSNDAYMDRQIDGQPTDSNRRPYRQADGQQTPDNYVQPPTTRGAERRPIGLDRMVPGEPSNDEFPQYQNSNYSSSNEQRVVTGVDHDYTIPVEASNSDVREQNVDGSDYTEQLIRNPARDIMAREASDASPDYSAPLEDQQREVTMEGENLQDLSIISSSDVSYAREPTFDGANADPNDTNKDRTHEAADSVECLANNSRRQSLSRVTSGEDSERDRTFKSSPRRDKDKRKSSREHDRDRDIDRNRDRDRDKEGRYSRSDRKYDRDNDRRSVRDDRRSDKDRKDRDRDRDRRDRGDSPDSRRYRRKGHRYETEDTDYYSDKERERRRYREGSYKSSKPPRPEDKDRRHEERDRNRRYNTIERDRRYDDERDAASRSRRDERHRERYERSERGYRDIDPTRKHGNLRREHDDEERRRVVTFSGDATSGSINAQGESYSSPSRAGSRGAAATDDEPPDDRRDRHDRHDRHERHDRHDRRRARSHRPDPYYDVAGYAQGAYDPYALQRRQYEYYERLRRADPAAYMRLYKSLMAGHAPLKLYTEGYNAMGYEGRGEERGSVHSGRSSANGLKGNDTWRAAAFSDLHTDFSDRELTTDASLNLHLEESTVRSERMTPFKFSTAHIKGSLSSRALVVVRAAYPVDGPPAAVQLLPLAALLAAAPAAADLLAYPGPLVKGVTHKKSVLDYVQKRIRDLRSGVGGPGVGGGGGGGGRDVVGGALLWQLLELLLRQNGVVVGTDIAELLMKNTQEFEYKTQQQPSKLATRTDSRRTSSAAGERSPEPAPPAPLAPPAPAPDALPQAEETLGSQQNVMSEKEAVDRLREYLIYGNRQEALEWAMSAGLWGHALALAAHGGKRARALVAARFQAALPPRDPLHTLYAALAARPPPAATCVADERWGDWRPHAAIILSNESAKPDQDRRTLIQLGDTLSARGLIYSAQFCYLAAGEPLAPHPLAPFAGARAAAPPPPPRLALLLADPRAPSLAAFATNQAIFATEIYEYALSLSQDYVINELQAYKVILASRLAEMGLCERALRYAEQAARAVARQPRAFPPLLLHRLATLADRLKYFDPVLQEGDAGTVEEGGEESGAGVAGGAGPGDGSSEPSPRHQQWLTDVTNIAHALSLEASQHTTPQHQADNSYVSQQQYNEWGDQTLHQQHANAPHYPEPADETTNYNAHYYAQTQPPAPPAEPPAAPAGGAGPAPGAADGDAPYGGYGDDWQRTDDAPAHQPYTDYWQPDATHYGYEAGGGGGGGGAEEAAPRITMPGAAPRGATYDAYDAYDDPPSGNHQQQQQQQAQQGERGGSRAAEGGGKGGEGAGGAGGGETRGKAEARRGGWLGGFLTKLALRPPNQMILPDDKNPTIVWDEQHKRWRNTDADADEPPAAPPPPPRLQTNNTSTPLQSPGAPPTAPGSNIYKMQKSRQIKKSYVDVLNPGGVAPPAPAPAPPAPAYFVPAATSLEVSIPSTCEDSPLPTPTPTCQGGIYDPTQLAEEEPYRSAI